MQKKMMKQVLLFLCFASALTLSFSESKSDSLQNPDTDSFSFGYIQVRKCVIFRATPFFFYFVFSWLVFVLNRRRPQRTVLTLWLYLQVVHHPSSHGRRSELLLEMLMATRFCFAFIIQLILNVWVKYVNFRISPFRNFELI